MGKYLYVKQIRRFARRFQYIHPSKRHLVLITICFWISAITLWTIRTTQNTSEAGGLFEDATDVNTKNPYYAQIESWHKDDANLPKLFPNSNSQWKYYPKKELFAWHEVPLHSVRAIVSNNKSYLGEMGIPVKLPWHLEAEAKERFADHQLNVVASDLVSLNRRLPDGRHQNCQIVQYPDRLPKTSVIVVFHNEAWSTLLRTVHSVINRSPPSLLKEVLLIDDASTNQELGQKLDDYLSTLPVSSRVVRMPKREGLINARLTGAEQASGSVLVFLDAHTEASPGWLPPILGEIVQDRTRVILPVVDDIVDTTFAYDPTENDHNRGGLDWKLMHAWIDPAPLIQDQNPEDAFPTPTMIGCAFAIDREFFFASGAYDDQMKIWGGENVEMSVRVWRCGGSLMVVPCSRIGHVYRKNTPHTVPGGFFAKADVFNANTARFAEVWLDQFKNFFYYMYPNAKTSNIGDVSQRKALIKELKCHSFQWYLDHVYPDSAFPHNQLYSGQIQHKASETCLDAVGSKSMKITLKMCHGLGTYQTFHFTKNGELRSENKCVTPDEKSKSGEVKLIGCDFSKAQKWTFKLLRGKSFGQLIHTEDGLCLTFTSKDSNKPSKKSKSMLAFLSNVVTDLGTDLPVPFLSDCDETKAKQLWSMNLPLRLK